MVGSQLVHELSRQELAARSPSTVQQVPVTQGAAAALGAASRTGCRRCTAGKRTGCTGCSSSRRCCSRSPTRRIRRSTCRPEPHCVSVEHAWQEPWKPDLAAVAVGGATAVAGGASPAAADAARAALAVGGAHRALARDADLSSGAVGGGAAVAGEEQASEATPPSGPRRRGSTCRPSRNRCRPRSCCRSGRRRCGLRCSRRSSSSFPDRRPRRSTPTQRRIGCCRCRRRRGWHRRSWRGSRCWRSKPGRRPRGRTPCLRRVLRGNSTCCRRRTGGRCRRCCSCCWRRPGHWRGTAFPGLPGSSCPRCRGRCSRRCPGRSAASCRADRAGVPGARAGRWGSPWRCSSCRCRRRRSSTWSPSRTARHWCIPGKRSCCRCCSPCSGRRRRRSSSRSPCGRRRCSTRRSSHTWESGGAGGAVVAGAQATIDVVGAVRVGAAVGVVRCRGRCSMRCPRRSRCWSGNSHQWLLLQTWPLTAHWVPWLGRQQLPAAQEAHRSTRCPRRSRSPRCRRNKLLPMQAWPGTSVQSVLPQQVWPPPEPVTQLAVSPVPQQTEPKPQSEISLGLGAGAAFVVVARLASSAALEAIRGLAAVAGVAGCRCSRIAVAEFPQSEVHAAGAAGVVPRRPWPVVQPELEQQLPTVQLPLQHLSPLLRTASRWCR